MVYFRVRSEADGARRFTRDKKGRIVCNGVLIANELYTRYEFIKLENGADCFEQVTMPKNKTHFFCGVRFADESEVN